MPYKAVGTQAEIVTARTTRTSGTASRDLVKQFLQHKNCNLSNKALLSPNCCGQINGYSGDMEYKCYF